MSSKLINIALDKPAYDPSGKLVTVTNFFCIEPTVTFIHDVPLSERKKRLDKNERLRRTFGSPYSEQFPPPQPDRHECRYTY